MAGCFLTQNLGGRRHRYGSHCSGEPGQRQRSRVDQAPRKLSDPESWAPHLPQLRRIGLSATTGTKPPTLQRLLPRPLEAGRPGSSNALGPATPPGPHKLPYAPARYMSCEVVLRGKATQVSLLRSHSFSRQGCPQEQGNGHPPHAPFRARGRNPATSGKASRQARELSMPECRGPPRPVGIAPGGTRERPRASSAVA